jgi:hypothetical protein
MIDLLKDVIDHAVAFAPKIEHVLFMPDENEGKTEIHSMVLDKTFVMSASIDRVDENLKVPMCIGNLSFLKDIIIKIDRPVIETTVENSYEGFEIINSLDIKNETFKIHYETTDPKMFNITGVKDLPWSEPVPLVGEVFDTYNKVFNLFKKVDSKVEHVSLQINDGQFTATFGSLSHTTEANICDVEKSVEMEEKVVKSDILEKVLRHLKNNDGGLFYFCQNAIKFETMSEEEVMYSFTLPLITRPNR